MKGTPLALTLCVLLSGLMACARSGNALHAKSAIPLVKPFPNPDETLVIDFDIVPLPDAGHERTTFIGMRYLERIDPTEAASRRHLETSRQLDRLSIDATLKVSRLAAGGATPVVLMHDLFDPKTRMPSTAPLVDGRVVFQASTSSDALEDQRAGLEPAGFVSIDYRFATMTTTQPGRYRAELTFHSRPAYPAAIRPEIIVARWPHNK